MWRLGCQSVLPSTISNAVECLFLLLVLGAFPVDANLIADGDMI